MLRPHWGRGAALQYPVIRPEYQRQRHCRAAPRPQRQPCRHGWGQPCRHGWGQRLCIVDLLIVCFQGVAHAFATSYIATRPTSHHRGVIITKFGRSESVRAMPCRVSLTRVARPTCMSVSAPVAGPTCSDVSAPVAGPTYIAYDATIQPGRVPPHRYKGMVNNADVFSLSFKQLTPCNMYGGQLP